jgi:exopolysaccharide production protein ExoY
MRSSVGRIGGVRIDSSNSANFQHKTNHSIEEIVSPRREQTGFYSTRGKRIFDIIFSLCLLPALLPIVTILAFVVSLSGGAPFFKQTRIGRSGRLFSCYKLRSMVIDAEKQLPNILLENEMAAAEWSERQKIERDPRVTVIGRVLRKTGIDELPQFLNVLRGEMTLVGPRPILPEELERYGRFAPHYLALRPGLTGLWQISDRSVVSYDERVQMDVKYQGNVTFLGDLWIILRTPVSVLFSLER